MSPRATMIADGWLAVLVAGAVALLIFPVPAPVLDALLAAQLGVAVVVLLAAVFARHPLALSQLPAVLLVTTLVRLALNVSTTRLILADADAGRVVAAFGDAVVRGNLVVGAVVFAVLVLVQYLVIAKGAERVAQVAARFALDGLPGRQLAIDADVRAGLLDPEAARAQRAGLARESSLFGALDGAMKFVRGDAIAGLCIVGINVVGGLVVGIGQQGRSPADAVALYTTLTIGDGLVSQ
ncbi:MAG: FHIPEP family type III secretion protein, partial [Myxococcales bacterium]|nr:FHIPEP family type III secretion protein [Myxococcales bacterium]